MTDVHGRAIEAYFRDGDAPDLQLHTSYGDIEQMPVDVFFDDVHDFCDIETMAIKLCRSATLDIGAGAGRHALALQREGVDVTAIDVSPGCARVMAKRGVRRVEQGEVQHHKGTYNTLLMLMNGIGLVGTVAALPSFFEHCATLLAAGGELIFDSSDVQYLYADGALPKAPYYGELLYRYEFQEQSGPWFPWLYIDPETLYDLCRAEGLHLDVMLTEPDGHYLGRICGF